MSLIHFLKKSPDARKIFGERELKIIEKQLWGVNLTQSEKNRISRDIRRKFVFIQHVARFAEEFSLKKGAEVRKKIAEVKLIILQDQLSRRIQRMFLFGSAVENALTLQSDLDIAVLFDFITLPEATLFRKRVLGRAPEKADIQVYNILPPKIKEEIDKKGKVIYERTKDSR